MVKNIVNEVISKTSGLFDEVYEKHLNVYLETVDDLLDKTINRLSSTGSNIFINKKTILLSAGLSYKEMLIQQCRRLLIGKLYENKENLKGETAEERYQWFVANFISTEYDDVFAKDTEITRILSISSINTQSAIDEFLSRFCQDYLELCELIGEPINTLNDISIGKGDVHNQGRNVYIITVNESKKIVYKPHSLCSDEILINVFYFFNKHNSVKLNHVPYINKDSYGWQKYISFIGCDKQYEVENYFYRYGCILFIAYLLNCTDLHFENIIACGEHPYIVDTETLLFNRNYLNGAIISKIDGLDRKFIDSVFSSYLLPVNIETAPIDAIDMSGIYNGSDKIIEHDVVTNAGTDNIGFEKVSFQVDMVADLKNQIKLAGKSVIVNDYIESIVKGFENCYRIYLNNREEFIEKCASIHFSDSIFRQVLRNTKLYTRYLEASYHPYYLNDIKDRINLFSNLKGSKNFNIPEFSKLIELESVQLVDGDIPYFYTKFDDHAIYSFHGKIERFYDKTIRDLLNEKLEKLSPKDMAMNTYFIRCSLAKYENKKELSYGFRFHEPPKSYQAFDVAIAIADYINEHHIVTHSGDNYSAVFSIIEENNEHFLGCLKPRLYDGLGLAIFYLQLYKHTDNEKYLHCFENLIAVNKDFSIFSQYIEAKQYGAFNGAASFIYLYYIGWITLRERSYLELYHKAVDGLLDAELDDYDVSDVIGGHAGIIIMAMNIYKYDEERLELVDLIKKCAKQLYALYLQKKIPVDHGVAHGMSGIACALMTASNITGAQIYYKTSLELLKKDHQLYKEDADSIDFWCYGGGGELILRTLMLPYLVPEDKEEFSFEMGLAYKRVKDSLDNHDKNSDMLCHGNLGNLDALLFFSKNQEQAELIDNITDKILCSIVKNGFKFDNRVKAQDISFMTGLSGIGYYFLKYSKTEVPSILAFEVEAK